MRPRDGFAFSENVGAEMFKTGVRRFIKRLSGNSGLKQEDWSSLSGTRSEVEQSQWVSAEKTKRRQVENAAAASGFV